MTKPINPSPKLSPAYGDAWDEYQDDRLRDCAAGGLSRKEAGLLLGRTELSVRGRANVLGIRFIRDSYGGLTRPYQTGLHHEERNALEDGNERLLRALATAFANGDHISKKAVRV